jgi:hypothetical protein
MTSSWLGVCGTSDGNGKVGEYPIARLTREVTHGLVVREQAKLPLLQQNQK